MHHKKSKNKSKNKTVVFIVCLIYMSYSVSQIPNTVVITEKNNENNTNDSNNNDNNNNSNQPKTAENTDLYETQTNQNNDNSQSSSNLFADLKKTLIYTKESGIHKFNDLKLNDNDNNNNNGNDNNINDNPRIEIKPLDVTYNNNNNNNNNYNQGQPYINIDSLKNDPLINYNNKWNVPLPDFQIIGYLLCYYYYCYNTHSQKKKHISVPKNANVRKTITNAKLRIFCKKKKNYKTMICNIIDIFFAAFFVLFCLDWLYVYVCVCVFLLKQR